MNPRLWVWLFLGILSISAAGQAVSDPPSAEPSTAEPDTPARPDQLSEAERIARLQRRIAETQKQIDDLTARLRNPESEYELADQAFRQIDDILADGKTNLERLRVEGASEAVIAQSEQDISLLEKRWRLSKERFDLAIEERKASQGQLTALEQKLGEDKAALLRLSPPPLNPASPQASAPTEGSAAKDPAPSGPAIPLNVLPLPKPAAAAPTEAQPAAPNGVASPDATAQPGTTEPGVPSEKIVKAQEAASTKEAEAREAEAAARSIEARITALRESIAAERKLLKTAQQQSDNAFETKQVLNEEMQTRWGAGATWAELRDLRAKIAEADKRIAAARQESRERTERLDDMQSELNALQAERIIALQQAETSRRQAEEAKQALAELYNPFSPDNLIQWALDHGPKIIGIVIVSLILLALARVAEGRLVPVIARHSRGTSGSQEDRENRARTLLGVFHNAVRIVVIVGGGLMLLTELGMNILPLITAAGVVGLAIAFGAQNLIRDYFYGFIILLENQYTINDVVRIGGIAGMVERITLRITVLRDLEGVVHFIPHGEIKSVSNLTHGWSRAMFDVAIAYREKPDQVMKVLMDLGREMRRDPEYSAFILDDPEMLGVNELGDSAVIIRFLIKTRALKQWLVKREMLRRIKNRFDELGIEIPFPHQTVYNRFDQPDQHNGADENDPKMAKWVEGPYAAR